MAGYLRGQIAEMADINVETLRYYEKSGLIPTPMRNNAGYRLYPEEIVTQIEFIKMAKYCGFTLSQIKQLLSKVEDQAVDMSYFLNIVDTKVNKIESEIIELEKVKTVLTNLRNGLQEPHKSFKVQKVAHTLKI